MIGRMLARMALVQALTVKTPYGDYPTIAGDRVFDSRMTPVQLTSDNPEIPIIVVYSGEQRAKEGKYEQSARFARFPMMNEFIIEIAVAAYSEQIVEEDGKRVTQKVLNIVENDEEVMAVLDMFEAQVWRVLHDAGNPWSVVWAKLIRNATDYSSDLEADGEKNNLMALRQIKLTVELCPDPMPAYGTTSEDKAIIPPRYDPDEEKFSGLVDTYLGEMIKGIAGLSDASSIVAALRSTLGDPQAILLPTLKRVSMIYHANNATPQEPATELGTQEIELGQESDENG